MNLREAIAEAAQSIKMRDAEVLLAHILQRDRPWLFAHIEESLSGEQLGAFRALTARRAAHVPLQHLVGEQEFFGLTLRVTRDTLIPRPETELLVEAVLSWIAEKSAAPHALRILDLGTGTGAIAIALAKRLANAELTATDISPAALAIARENAARHHLANRIKFVESDLLAALPDETFDIMVSNPPYVALADASTLAPEVRDHEPHLALFAGNDGLDMYRRLIPQVHKAIASGGLLALEIGYGQSEAIRALFAECEWRNLRVMDDYAGIPRIVLAERV